MKKSILILILAGLVTSCMPVENSQESSEISTAQEVTEASESEEISESEEYSEIETQPSTECEISTTEATVTTAEIQSETICTTTAITDVQKKKVNMIQRIIQYRISKMHWKNLPGRALWKIHAVKKIRIVYRGHPVKLRRLRSPNWKNMKKKPSLRCVNYPITKRLLKSTNI